MDERSKSNALDCQEFLSFCGRIGWCDFQNKLISLFVFKVFELLKRISPLHVSTLPSPSVLPSVCFLGLPGVETCSCGFSVALIMLFTN